MKNMEKTVAFMGGLAMGLMYMKYEKEINRCIKTMRKTLNV